MVRCCLEGGIGDRGSSFRLHTILMYNQRKLSGLVAKWIISPAEDNRTVYAFIIIINNTHNFDE